MVSLAHLSREERIGLLVAGVAHAALVAVLVFHVDDPTPLPIPERMDVSLATEVSLESTSPDPSAEPQAAIAPELSPEPAPLIEPQPEPAPTRAVERPTPAPRPTPTARPAPTPSPTARPRPSPTPTPTARATPTPRPSPTRAGGSRIGSDFLEGTGGSQRSVDRGSPAATFGPAEQASLQSAINRKLRPQWSAPSGVDAELLVTVLVWELNEDGTLKGRPQVVRQSGINDSNRPQASLHAERAIRAVQLAAPFDLPPEFYSRWRRLTWEFDRNLSR